MLSLYRFFGARELLVEGGDRGLGVREVARQ
jgi:hypothetical protein